MMMAPPIRKPEPIAPPVRGMLQRKCACGGTCASCADKEKGLQRKLAIGSSNDPLEREADRVADQVLANRTQSDFSRVPISVQRHTPSEARQSQEAPPSVHRALAMSGRPLDAPVRQEMETRFGHDFSQVRIHQGGAAEQSARDVGAQAYTVGSHIVFGAGRLAPETPQGRRLLAHELTHVVQQEAAADGGAVRVGAESAGFPSARAAPGLLMRQEITSVGKDPDLVGGGGLKPKTGEDDVADVLQKLLIATGKSLLARGEKLAKAYLKKIAEKPGTGARYTQQDCPSNFCDPFEDKAAAREDLKIAGPIILAGIARDVNSRVVPLWVTYLSGGASVQDLTGEFAEDFTSSKKTLKVTKYLHSILKLYVIKNVRSLIGRKSGVELTFGTGNVKNPPELNEVFFALGKYMNFNDPTEIPGNIAGGVTENQSKMPIGAKPSPYDDMRHAKISVELVRTPTGVLATPTIDFTVVDTIDLCPGNCSDNMDERVATIPLSRFEATDLVGDVPFIVDFPAPAEATPPFEIPVQIGIPGGEEADSSRKSDKPAESGGSSRR